METKVILPIFIPSSCRRQKKNAKRQPPKFEFTLEEALRYMISNNCEWMLMKLVLCNVNLRNEMRKVGAKALMEQLRLLVEPNEELEREMRCFVERWEGKALGDIDIQVLPIDAPFTVDGIEFDGLAEVSASVEKSYHRSFLDNDYPRDIKPSIKPKCHVGTVWEPYPTFDIYDTCDDRYYRNFLIRRGPVQGDELKAVYGLGHFNFCAITEETPANLLPLVYYRGDGGFMLVAERHSKEE